MSININERYSELMADLEANIENKKDLEYIKEKFGAMFLEFLYELEGITIESEKKLTKLEERQKQIEEKSERIEQMVQRIEKDIYINDNYDFEVVCPYCNTEFETEYDEMKNEVICPGCNNIIELDWNEDEEFGCDGHCSGCHSGCGDIFELNDDDSEDDEEIEELDDDM